MVYLQWFIPKMLLSGAVLKQAARSPVLAGA